jgi:hypothetical protein
VGNMVKRVVFTCASVVAAATVTAAPAQAAPAQTNEYTPAAACTEDEGGNWIPTLDGHRAIEGPDGQVIGDVHLMWDAVSGRNCVVTLKRVDVGKKTPTQASVQRPGEAPTDEIGTYDYYAAVAVDARDICVMYGGAMSYQGKDYFVEREQWENCGG